MKDDDFFLNVSIYYNDSARFGYKRLLKETTRSVVISSEMYLKTTFSGSSAVDEFDVTMTKKII